MIENPFPLPVSHESAVALARILEEPENTDAEVGRKPLKEHVVGAIDWVAKKVMGNEDAALISLATAAGALVFTIEDVSTRDAAVQYGAPALGALSLITLGIVVWAKERRLDN